MKPSHALLGAGVIVAAATFISAARAADDTIKIGVLHSLSGTMAISETTLKDTVLMMVDDINKRGGLLGKKVEAVVVDPRSDWPTFAEKAGELLEQDHVAAIFGCWTSVSRKSVLPVIAKDNGLLFYPVQYEGEESQRGVFYTGAAPNQQAIPAVEYLMSADGGSVKRWILEGTDYVYPRTTNKILRAFLKLKGVDDADIMENYTPFGFSDWQTEVGKIKAFGAGGKKTAVVSTINGDANVPFYKELSNEGIKASDIPVVAFSVGEEELSGMDTKNLVGHLAAWNYFESVKTPENEEFIKNWHAFIKNDKRTTNDPMEATYIGFHMWSQAVMQAGTTDVDAVREAMIGQKVKNLTGSTAVMLPNHHLTKPVLIGEIRADGQFNVVSKTAPVAGEAWASKYLAEDKGKVANWLFPWVCESCTSPTYKNYESYE
jgi:urea transport system substrate-binding protein